MTETKKTSEIKFTVHLDEAKLPVKIDWYASDAGLGDNKTCKALMISLFDEKEATTLKIDLWTKDMLVDEMKRFFAETFMSMADTYDNATGDKEMTEGMRKFAREFAEKAGVIHPK